MSSETKNTDSFGNQIYSGASSFGIFWALASAIIGTIIGIVLIAVGIYFLTKRNNRKEYNAVVLYVNGPGGSPCQLIQSTQGQASMYSCTVTITYSGWHEPIDIDYTGSSTFYIGQHITIYVDKNNPTDVSLSPPVPVFMGWIFIGIGIIIILAGWFWFWAARKWKFVAAAEGVGGVLGIVSGGRW